MTTLTKIFTIKTNLRNVKITHGSGVAIINLGLLLNIQSYQQTKKVTEINKTKNDENFVN